MQIQSIIAGLLVTVAMAAPATDIEARQAGRVAVQACACANAQGETTVGSCLNGWGSHTKLDGQYYCFPYRLDQQAGIANIFSPEKCSNLYAPFSTSTCKTVFICPSYYDQYDIC